MPREPRSVRTPSFRAKLNQIKGLRGEEKALFQRIGNLIDTITISQRQVANPRDRRRKVTEKIPRPTGVTANGITGGAQLSWNAVSLSKISIYEAQVSESATFADPQTFEVVGTRISIRTIPESGTLFFRVRSLTKDGKASRWTDTVSLSVSGSQVYRADQDAIEPENTTSVEPHPQLLGAELEVVLGSNLFVGYGAYIGPSPLTLNDQHEGYTTNVDIRHEVAADIFEVNSPFPSTEQRIGPTIGEYIDVDAYYTFSDSFYIRPTLLPSHYVDFFDVLSLTLDPSQHDIEFLRRRILGSFYFPAVGQTGFVGNASMAAIKF